MSVLSSIKIVEFEGLGPGPFCGMLLADLGADVVAVERPDGADPGRSAVYRRGKRSIALDLKNRQARDLALKIVAGADALIEGLRPGVMERLGLGPADCMARNPGLVYGRLTGWGQDGPLSAAAGHDINYVALSGAAWYAASAGDAPVPPPTLVGDVGGGALYLAIGLLAGVIEARESGQGRVVDAAIVDGSAHMMSLLYSLRAAGGMPDDRGESMLDGAHFYDIYRCADEKYISIGALESKFYAALLEKLGLASDAAFANQYDRDNWPQMKKRFAEIFAMKTREEWRDLLEGTDVCFAPVLSPSEAAAHPHMKARNTLRDIDGVLQAAPAPRFGGGAAPDPGPVPNKGAHADEILKEAGLDESEIKDLRMRGVV
ncbi:MAG: CaiB/BaiF CoA transferase family protein [Parvularculaceae bacterium]